MFHKKIDTAILIIGTLCAAGLADCLAETVDKAPEIQYVDRPVYVQRPQVEQYCVVGAYVVNQTINNLRAKWCVIKSVTLAAEANGNQPAQFLITYELGIEPSQ